MEIGSQNHPLTSVEGPKRCSCGESRIGRMTRCGECHAAYQRSWRRGSVLTPQQRAKANARRLARHAKARGDITQQPCACGSLNSQMHHDDYSKPLEVKWICRPCHMDIHYPGRQSLGEVALIRLRKVDDGYDVMAIDGTVIGYTFRAPDQAWSYAPWVIEGIHETVAGGVNGAHKRRRGWRTRDAAVREICVMNSSKLCQVLA
jgi:hypothetical protein